MKLDLVASLSCVPSHIWHFPPTFGISLPHLAFLKFRVLGLGLTMVLPNQEDLHDVISTSGESSSFLLEEEDTSSSDSDSSSFDSAFIYLETFKDSAGRCHNKDASISSMSLSLSSDGSSTDDDDFDDDEDETESEESDLKLEFRRSDHSLTGEIPVHQSRHNPSSDDFTFASLSSSLNSSFSSCEDSYSEEETIDDGEGSSKVPYDRFAAHVSLAEAEVYRQTSKGKRQSSRSPLEETSRAPSEGNRQCSRMPRREKKGDQPIQEHRGHHPIRRTQSSSISRIRRRWEQERASSSGSLDHCRPLSTKESFCKDELSTVSKSEEIQQAYRMLRRNIDFGIGGLQIADSNVQPLLRTPSRDFQDQQVSLEEHEEAGETAASSVDRGFSELIEETVKLQLLLHDPENEESNSCAASSDQSSDDNMSKEMMTLENAALELQLQIQQVALPQFEDSCKKVLEAETHQEQNKIQATASQENEDSCELGFMLAETIQEQSKIKDFVEKSHGTASTIDTICSEERNSTEFHVPSIDGRATVTSLEAMRYKVKSRIKEATGMIASSRVTKELNVASSNASKLIINGRQKLRKSWNVSLVLRGKFLKKHGFKHQAEQNISSN
jgi:hypothetical protein